MYSYCHTTDVLTWSGMCMCVGQDDNPEPIKMPVLVRLAWTCVLCGSTWCNGNMNERSMQTVTIPLHYCGNCLSRYINPEV